MASLTDIKGLTEQLVEKAQEVLKEVESGNLDFARLVKLSDELGSEADKLAALFQSVNEAFVSQLDNKARKVSGDLSEDLKPSRRGRSRSNGSRSGGKSSREQLYERAKRLDVPGRSQMSKDQLEKAVQRGRRNVKS